MKKILLLTIFFVTLFYSINAGAYFTSQYYNESIEGFINSPNKDDIDKIENELQRYCEQVYLKATRRREYTQLEIKYCGEIFEVKRQQELDYITYMYRNRGIYY